MTTAFKIINESEPQYADGSPNQEVILIRQYGKPNHILREIVVHPKTESETLYVWNDTSFTIEEVSKNDLL